MRPKSLDVSKAIDKQRYDGQQIRAVTAWIAEARAAAGVTNGQIDAAFGFNGMAGHWTTQGAQASVPTLEQVPRLLGVLGVEGDDVPEDVRRLLLDLNGRKGQPGDAWFRREKIGEQTKARSEAGASALPTMGAATEYRTWDVTTPATHDAAAWQGWGTALAPSHEPIVVARKPLSGTVASNVLRYGTGAINIDATRIVSTRSTSRLLGCPSIVSAPHAEVVSAWLPVDLPEAKGRTALALAATHPAGDPVALIRTGEADGSSARMAMSLSDTGTDTNWNTGSSWRDWLADRSNGGNTSITATATALTTDPRTLSCCRWLLTDSGTPPSATAADGCACDAWPVAETSTAGSWKWSGTHLRIAPATATAPAGRWPKNVVFCHVPGPDGCRRVGERRVNTGTTNSRTPTTGGMFAPGEHDLKRNPWVDADGMETVEAWDCKPECPVGQMGEPARFFATFHACGDESTRAASTSDGASQATAECGPSSRTDGRGNSTTDPSPTGTRSTTSIGTRSTTTSAISDSSRPPSTTICTSESERTTEPSEASSTGGANGAASIAPSTPSTSGEQGHGRGTASPAPPLTSASGVNGTPDGRPNTTGGTEPRWRYEAKASSAERNAGLGSLDAAGEVIEGGRRNVHPLEPTVKPVKIMQWLVRLVTPPGGLVLDPFAGSGTTGCAAALEGVRFVGIEKDESYAAIAEARIAWWRAHPDGVEIVERLASERQQARVRDTGQDALF